MNADLQPDGGYEVITAEGAGLPVGAYQVCVHPPLSNPGIPSDAPKNRQYPNIPQQYRACETSGLTLTVNEGKNQFDIAMKP